MTLSSVEYDLQDGFIHHWLTAGPQATPIPDLAEFPAERFKALIFQKYSTPRSGIKKMPVERGPMSEGLFNVGDYQGSWGYARCGEDHTVDHSTSKAVCHHLRSWAFTRLDAAKGGSANFELRTCGPVDVWVNREHIFHDHRIGEQAVRHSFQAGLVEGKNDLLVRFEAVAAPSALLYFSLRVLDPEGMRVSIPTLIPSLERRAELEQVYQTLYLDRDVYAPGEEIVLHWPADLEKPASNSVDLRGEDGMIYGHADDVGKPGDSLFLGHPVSLAAGKYRAVVMPLGWEFYDSQIRITHEIPAYVMGNTKFSDALYGTQGERCVEALTYATRLEDDLFAEIAKMALHWWEIVDARVIQRALEKVSGRQPGSSLAALGLLGMQKRYGGEKSFPRWLKQPVKAGLLNFKYAGDEPGLDLMDFSSEAGQILSAAGEILAGQAYPNQVFANSGLTGVQHRVKGEQRALAWMQARSQRGFDAWDSPEVLAGSLTALTYLIDFARSEPVWGLASVLMDKLLFSIALNSFKGAFGSTRGQAQSLGVKSCLLDATSGITRIAWGMGVFNTYISSTVSFALMEKYELPAILADIAAGSPGEIWNKEQTGSDQPVNKVSYRSPYGMLSSAQDYRPGQPGAREHIWQATLAPNCVVFSNHPGCSNELDERAPNFWRGNGILPRVAQWKDALIAVYRLERAGGSDELMGFTHAYLPYASFDEISRRGNWIFGRKGEGFVALTASGPIEEIQMGRTARRELRVQGAQTTWLCQMGSAAQDGDFDAFQAKVVSAPCRFDGLNVEWQTARGEKLTFGWEGPCTRDGQALPLNGFKHFDNPYTTADFPCEKMEIQTEEYVLRLDLSG